MSDNGKQSVKPAEVQRPLKDNRRSVVEAGLRAFHETSQEVEDLKAEIDKQRRDLMARDLEIVSLRERADQMMEAHTRELMAIESRIREHEATRDQAVAEKVALETILVSMRSIFRLAPLPEERPLVRMASPDAADTDEER